MTDTCWSLPDRELEGLTAERARDLVVECFFHAQRETFARAKQKLGSSQTDAASLRANVVGAVRLAFKESGGDYDHPTAASIGAAVAILGRKAKSWGTPDDIVQHHGAQIQQMLGRLRG